MTTEDDFQSALDAQPDDWQTRLVFADWLQERGDPRAEGYRAMGRVRVWTVNVNTSGEGLKLWTWYPPDSTSGGVRQLPFVWFVALESWECITSFGDEMDPTAHQWRDYRSRREADDAAALAFAKLAKKTRAAILNSSAPRRKRR